jgi:hypothetical protein
MGKNGFSKLAIFLQTKAEQRSGRGIQKVAIGTKENVMRREKQKTISTGERGLCTYIELS